MQLLVDAAVAVAAAVTALAGASYVVVRMARRRWRALREQAVLRGAVAAWAGFQALRVGRRAAATEWSPARARREIWRALAAAERAVDHAESAGAPLGDLVALARRLRLAADEMDRLLAHGAFTPVVRDELDHLLAAADDVRQAAVGAAAEMAAPGVRQLADDAELELRAMAAGWRRTRSASPRW